MFCSNCGKEIDGRSKFCPFCGHEIEVSNNSMGMQPHGQPSNSPPLINNPASVNVQPAPTAYAPKPKMKIDPVFIAIVIVISVAVVYGLYKLGMSKYDAVIDGKMAVYGVCESTLDLDEDGMMDYRIEFIVENISDDDEIFVSDEDFYLRDMNLKNSDLGLELDAYSYYFDTGYFLKRSSMWEIDENNEITARIGYDEYNLNGSVTIEPGERRLVVLIFRNANIDATSIIDSNKEEKTLVYRGYLNDSESKTMDYIFDEDYDGFIANLDEIRSGDYPLSSSYED